MSSLMNTVSARTVTFQGGRSRLAVRLAVELAGPGAPPFPGRNHCPDPSVRQADLPARKHPLRS